MAGGFLALKQVMGEIVSSAGDLSKALDNVGSRSGDIRKKVEGDMKAMQAAAAKTGEAVKEASGESTTGTRTGTGPGSGAGLGDALKGLNR